MRDKDQILHFRVSKAELAQIKDKMARLDVRNMGAYLRKMALDGYCVQLDIGDVRELVRLLGIASNNLNQYARKANESGNIYKADIEDLQVRMQELWQQMQELLVRLSSIR